jgi:hypothetical protein
MPKAKLTAEEAAELNRLVAEHDTALRRAAAIAQRHGLESQTFRQADEKAGHLYRKIRELLGTTRLQG